MAGDDIAERLFERGGIERALQPDADRNVVARIRTLELMEEPEAGLRERQRQLRWTRLRAQRQAGFGESAQGTSQIAQHRRVEDRADGQFASEPRADLRRQPRGHQRVSAQVEEVVGEAYALEAQELAHQIAEQDLLGRGGRHVTGREAGALRRGQRLAVQLAVGRQRQRVENHERRRHHVVRQTFFKPSSQH